MQNYKTLTIDKQQPVEVLSTTGIALWWSIEFQRHISNIKRFDANQPS